MSPAHRHSSESGPRAIRDWSDGELSDVMLLSPKYFSSSFSLDRSPQRIRYARPIAGARKNLVAKDVPGK